MEKPANTILDINELIKRRYSPRSFSDQPIERNKLELVFEAARWSPSASNIQPWRFFVGIKGENEIYKFIYDSLTEFNQQWCLTVPVLVAISAFKINTKNNTVNFWNQYDTGQSAAFMSLQATELGLFTHQMGGFDKDLLAQSLQLPADLIPLAVMAIGYYGNYQKLPERYQISELAERNRKPQSDIVFYDFLKD